MFSRTGMKIVEFLADAPSKSFYEREISAQCGISAGAVNSHMRLLKSLDIVHHERRGKTTFYRINLDNFISREFKTLFSMIRLQELVAQLRPLAKRIILFGSAAEGTDTEESDIDLFILSSADREKIQGLIAKFGAGAGRKISPIIADSKDLALMREKPIYKNIQRGRILWDEKEHGV